MTIYAVNGKEPIAAWIPSLDTAGNGTTTLTDLSGNGRTGTLTNFALTGSTSNWVSDASNGGVRAIDFDATNDYIACGTGFNSLLNSGTEFSISAWVYRNVTGNFPRLFEFGAGSGSIYVVLSTSIGMVTTGTAMAGTSVTVSLTTWTHVVLTAKIGTGFTLYHNNVSQSITTSNAGTGNFNVSGSFTLGNRSDGIRPLAGRLDDVRVFNTVLNASDVSYLYNSGNGRGRVTAAGGKLIGGSDLVGKSPLVQKSALVSV